jgi:hypothetical protein
MGKHFKILWLVGQKFDVSSAKIFILVVLRLVPGKSPLWLSPAHAQELTSVCQAQDFVRLAHSPLLAPTTSDVSCWGPRPTDVSTFCANLTANKLLAYGG